MAQFPSYHMMHVFPHHGLPKVIVSNRDSKFYSAFWFTLFDNLGTTLDFTSAFHPESNGKIEATNHTIIDLLKSYARAFTAKEVG